MAITSTEITYTSAVSNSAKTLTLTDTASYGGSDLSWVSGDCRILAKIVDPLGNTVLNNTDTSSPNISAGGGNFSQTLPVDADGKIISGNYTVTLTYFDVAVPLTQFERSYVFNFSYERPTINLDITYSIINPIYFKSVDTTNYDYLGVTPTSTFTQVLYYPPSVGGTYTQTGKTLAVSTFYTGKGEVTQTPLNTYTFTTGYYSDATGTAVNWTLSDTWTELKNYEVSSVASSCDLECCLSEMQEQVELSKGKSSYDAKLAKFNYAASLLTLINQKFDCNKPSEVAALVEEFKQVTGCTGDCSCDSNPVQVVGVGTTPERTRKNVHELTSTASSYTWTQLIGYNFANGDFMFFIDGENAETAGYTVSFNPITGEVSWGSSLPSGVKIAYYIIKS